MSHDSGSPHREPGDRQEPQVRPAPIVWTSSEAYDGPAAWSGPRAFGNPEPDPEPEQSLPEPQHEPEPQPEPELEHHKPAVEPDAEALPQSDHAEPGARTSETDDALTIGRSRTNSIVLDDMLVSRRHVRITAEGEGLVLEDLGSRNGTFVNGRRVMRTHLHEGDRIGVGAAIFEVRDGWLVTI